MKSTCPGVDVLFVYVDYQTSSGPSTGLGVASMAGYLKRQKRRVDLAYFHQDADWQLTLDKVRVLKPRVVAISSPSSCIPSVIQLSKAIRDIDPAVFQILGGVHANLKPSVLGEIPSLDAVGVGFGEIIMAELLHALDLGNDVSRVPGLWWRDRGTGLITSAAPCVPHGAIDGFLEFDHLLFWREFNRYAEFASGCDHLEIIFNRGCPFDCAFCCNHALREVFGHRVFSPSPEKAIAALKHGVEETRARSITIHDDILTLNRAWFRTFIELYRHEIGLPFFCNLRAGTFDEDDVVLLKAANIRSAFIGLESGNEYVRNQILNKRVTQQQIRDSTQLLHKHGVDFCTFNMIGLPGETPERFLDTIRLNAEVENTANGQILYVFYPYPETALYKQCLAAGMLTSTAAHPVIERLQPVVEIPGFPKREIQFYTRNFQNLVRYEKLRQRRLGRFAPPLTPRNAHLIAGGIRLAKRAGRVFRVVIGEGFFSWLHDLWSTP